MKMLKDVLTKNEKLFEQNEELEKKIKFAQEREQFALNEHESFKRVIESLKEKVAKEQRLAAEQAIFYNEIQDTSETLKKRNSEISEKRDQLLDEVVELQKYKSFFDGNIADKEIENYLYIKNTFSHEQQANVFYEGILSEKSKLYKSQKDLETLEDRLNAALKTMAKLEDENRPLNNEIQRLVASNNKLTNENTKLKEKIQKMKEKASQATEENGLNETKEDTNNLVIEHVPKKRKLLKLCDQKNNFLNDFENGDSIGKKKESNLKTYSKNPFIPSNPS